MAGGGVATRDVFPDAELDQLRGFPEINQVELIRAFTLTPADEAFVQARRGMANRFGVAVQQRPQISAGLNGKD